MLKKIKKNQGGMTALLTIIVISAAVLIVVKNASLISITEADMAYMTEKGERALAIAEGCAEETLRRLQIDSSYTASDLSLPLGEGSCIINTISQGNSRTITIIGNIDEYYKKIEVTATINNNLISVNRWEEISD